jgi:hypothetical protein
MKTTLLLAILFLISISSIYGQEQNLATIVDESPKTIDLVFISKLGIMALLGIIAFFSYLKFRKTN